MTMIDLKAFLEQSGIERQTLDQWVELEWILPTSTTVDVQFSDADVARAIFIRDLRCDLGVNDEGVGIVLHLVDQVHGLRRLLQDIHRGASTDSHR